MAVSVELPVGLAVGNPFPNPTYRATPKAAVAVKTIAPRTALPAPDRFLANLTPVRCVVGTPRYMRSRETDGLGGTAPTLSRGAHLTSCRMKRMNAAVSVVAIQSNMVINRTVPALLPNV